MADKNIVLVNEVTGKEMNQLILIVKYLILPKSI